jgi:integrase
MKHSDLNGATPSTDMQSQTDEKRLNTRLLALNNPIGSKLLPPSQVAELHRRVTTRPLTACKTVEGELIERGCRFISLLVTEGGASVALPVKLIEQLKIAPDEAQNGYIRWSAATRNKNIGRLLGSKARYAQGPRQFLYSDCQCCLLAFLNFRISRMKAKVGDMLLAPATKDLIAAARKDLTWLKSIKGKITWAGIFRAWLENLFSDAGVNRGKIVAAITEGSLWRLYRHEPPLLLGVRRGCIIIAPLPDKQFLNLLPSSFSLNISEKAQNRASNLINTEEFLDSSESAATLGANTEDERTEDKRAIERKCASTDLRSFLRSVVDQETSYKEAAAQARLLLETDAFQTQSTKDYYFSLRWLIAKFDFGGKNRNRVTSLQTYARRLIRLIDAFPDTPFSEITLDDMGLFLSQYSTANAAKFYRAVAANFYKYLRDTEKISVVEIDWKSPRLQFYNGYREQGVITETQFQSALECVEAASRLSPQQMRIIFLLLRRLGLRCAEVAWLTLRDFDGIAECRLVIEHSKTKAGRRALPIYLLLDDDEQAQLFDFLGDRRKALQGREPDAPLFELIDDSPLEAAQIGAEVTKVLEAAGIEYKTAHGLRHAFATGLVAAWWLRQTSESSKNQESNWARLALEQFTRANVEGRAVEYADDIRLLLGHADLEITFERYVHIIDLITADAVQIAESINSPAPLSTTVIAALAGTTVRAVIERFPSELRHSPQAGARATTIKVGEVKKWFVERLHNALKNHQSPLNQPVELANR